MITPEKKNIQRDLIWYLRDTPDGAVVPFRIEVLDETKPAYVNQKTIDSRAEGKTHAISTINVVEKKLMKAAILNNPRHTADSGLEIYQDESRLQQLQGDEVRQIGYRQPLLTMTEIILLDRILKVATAAGLTSVTAEAQFGTASVADLTFAQKLLILKEILMEDADGEIAAAMKSLAVDPAMEAYFADQLEKNIFDPKTGEYLVTAEDWVAVGEDIMRGWGVDPARSSAYRHPENYGYGLTMIIPKTNAEGKYIDKNEKEVTDPAEADSLSITLAMAHLWRRPSYLTWPPPICEGGTRYHVDPTTRTNPTGLLYLLPHIFGHYTFGKTTVPDQVFAYLNDNSWEWMDHVPNVDR